MRGTLLALIGLLQAILLFAQGTPTGGVKGRVLSKTERYPLEHARVSLMEGALLLQEVRTDSKGQFLLEEVPDGAYTLVIQASGYLENRVPVQVTGGREKNVFNLLLAELNRSSGSWEDFPGASSDLLRNLSGYLRAKEDFPLQQRVFRQELTLAGVRMDLWDSSAAFGDLPEAFRDSRYTSGAGLSQSSFGGLNGVAELTGTASSMRSGFRSSLSTDQALYGLRAALSYATGPLSGGWNLAANVSGSAWPQPETIPYAYYLGVDKSWGKAHKLGAAVLQDDALVAFLRHDYTPSARFRSYATVMGSYKDAGTLHLAGGLTWRPVKRFTLSAGADGRSGKNEGNNYSRADAWLSGQLALGKWGLSMGFLGEYLQHPLEKGFSYTAKLGVGRMLGQTLRAFANLGLSNPFHSRDESLFSTDLNLTLDTNGANVKLTAFHEAALSSSQSHMGLDLGFKVPLYVIPNLSLQGQLTTGYNVTLSLREPTLAYGGLAWSANAWFVDGGFLYMDHLGMADLSAGKTWLFGKRQLGVSAGVRPYFGDGAPPLRYSARVFCTL